ncbi:PIG-L family deacetylase [Nonomuraea sp. NPDC005983]|uniref:PIG-L family deacetylase n=1 Tax=Nonomuraea sp. NPDC005983 TaxID=3155595 RepID=UPI0033A28FDB
MKGIRVLCASLLALTLVAFTVCPVTVQVAAAVADMPSPGERFLQVVAHPDDDLLFMSPDLYGAVAQGRPTVTVYLTAGEGTAGFDDERDPSVYVRDREDGVRAAYAYLAGVRNAWRSTPLKAGRLPLTMDTLVDRPRVRLVFARLPDGGDPRADGGRYALTRLWKGGACVRVYLPGGPCVSREDVIAALHVLYVRFGSNVLRTLDPDPPLHTRRGDHPDHVASARFALAALQGLRMRRASYRGYPMTGWAPNVAARLRELKRQVFGEYTRHDYRVGGWRYRAWIERMYRIPDHGP